VGRSRTLARGAAALTVLGATVASTQLVGDAGRRRLTGEVEVAASARQQELREILASYLDGLEQKAQNAAAHPRLVAALSGGVSRETLQDIFETESWWLPVRESFTHTYLAPPGQAPMFLAGKKDLGLDLSALTARAWKSRAVTSQLVPSEAWPYAVVALPVRLPNPALMPVMLLVQPIEAAVMGKMAERSGHAVVLSDGVRALVGAGPAFETSRLRQAIGREAGGNLVEMSRDDGLAVAVAKVATGLWLLGYVEAAATVARVGAAYGAIRIAVGAVGGAIFLFLLGWLWRGTRPLPGPLSASAPIPDLPPPLAIPGEAASASGGGGRYVLLNRLGGGGMAEVHLAVSVGERGFRRACVVKRLRPELAANPVAVAQFTDEATLASSLVHANIVPIFDFVKSGKDYLLVEEYILGRDLGRLVRRALGKGKWLSPGVLAHIGMEVSKALDYAHEKRDHDGLPFGIVHRDVSPENIMVTVRGEVLLLDFGVMKVDYPRGGRPEIGDLKGNLSYMAPEQARGLEVDGRADLFSLASVLYFCLAGEPLYGQETGYDLLVKAASGPGPEELRKIASLPQPFAEVLGKALASRREDRYPSAVIFAQTLAPLAAGKAGETGALVQALFGDDLNQEQQQLAANTSAQRALAGFGEQSEHRLEGDLGR
jgi:tRNA A-37 threonylcarbamoyl transferase component Bud32